MARRAGKAANRKARQRKVNRPAASPPRPPLAPTLEAPAPEPSAPPRASVPAPSAARRPRASALGLGGSSLTATERSEYHYVERDLRNIAILTAAMIGLLLLAWLAFSAAGLVG